MVQEPGGAPSKAEIRSYFDPAEGTLDRRVFADQEIYDLEMRNIGPVSTPKRACGRDAGSLAPMPAPKRLHHFMVEMATLDDVGFAMDCIGEYGVKQTMTLGKHSNDQMVSFYAATPSGFEVEVGTAGIEVHDDVWRVTHHEVTSMWGHKRV